MPFYVLDARSGRIIAVGLTDHSRADQEGPLGMILSVLFEDGSILLLHISAKNWKQSLLQDLVHFKEGNTG